MITIKPIKLWGKHLKCSYAKVCRETTLGLLVENTPMLEVDGHRYHVIPPATGAIFDVFDIDTCEVVKLDVSEQRA